MFLKKGLVIARNCLHRHIVVVTYTLPLSVGQDHFAAVDSNEPKPHHRSRGSSRNALQAPQCLLGQVRCTTVPATTQLHPLQGAAGAVSHARVVRSMHDIGSKMCRLASSSLSQFQARCQLRQRDQDVLVGSWPTLIATVASNSKAADSRYHRQLYAVFKGSCLVHCNKHLSLRS